MAEQTPELHIYALGSPEVRKYKNLVTFPTRKSLALLIYLAVEPGAQTREHLATLLWPEANSERSYANLRNTLAHLQTALSRASEPSQVTYLSITHKSLALNPDANIEFDVRIVEPAYAQARADRSSRPLPDGSVSLPLLGLLHCASICVVAQPARAMVKVAMAAVRVIGFGRQFDKVGEAVDAPEGGFGGGDCRRHARGQRRRH